MRPLRGGTAALVAALVLGLALAAPADAQTVNESEFNTTADQPDESYLNDSSSGSSDPTLTESDLDTSAPPPDESYLGDASSDPQLGEGDFDTSVPPADEAYLGDGAATSADSAGKGVPAPALGLVLAGLALVALARRRSP